MVHTSSTLEGSRAPSVRTVSLDSAMPPRLSAAEVKRLEEGNFVRLSSRLDVFNQVAASIEGFGGGSQYFIEDVINVDADYTTARVLVLGPPLSAENLSATALAMSKYGVCCGATYTEIVEASTARVNASPVGLNLLLTDRLMGPGVRVLVSGPGIVDIIGPAVDRTCASLALPFLHI